MALANKQSVREAKRMARQASDLRVNGARSVGGLGGQSLSIMFPKIQKSGTIIMAYQGSWPNPIDELGQEQFIQAHQFVSIAPEPDSKYAQFPLASPGYSRYWRTSYTGSGIVLGITMERAHGRYHAIPVKLAGMAFLWIEPHLCVCPGERVGSQTGNGNAYRDNLGPATLVRRLPYDDPLAEGRELWLVRLSGFRGDSILVVDGLGVARLAKTVLFDYAQFVISNPVMGTVHVEARP